MKNDQTFILILLVIFIIIWYMWCKRDDKYERKTKKHYAYEQISNYTSATTV